MAREIDRGLLSGFVDEVADYLPQIIDSIELYSRNTDDGGALEVAYRLVHSIKGALSMLGLAVLSHIAHLAEETLEELAAGGFSEPLGAAETVALGIAQLGAYVSGLLGGEALDRPILSEVVPIFRRLRNLPESGDEAEIERMLASSSARPVPAEPTASPWPLRSMERASTELLEAFQQEAEDHLLRISQGLRELERHPQDSQRVQPLRRSVHTLKGTSAMVGLTELSRLAHRMEDLLDRLYEGSAHLSEEAMQLLFETGDALEDLVAERPVANLEAMLGRYTTLLGEETELAPAPPPPAADKVEPLAAERPFELTPSGGSSAGPREDHRSGPVIRVPIERLDDLVRLVGELLVNRSVFEQHFGSLLREADELGLSVGRLRRIAGRLDEREAGALPSGGRIGSGIVPLGRGPSSLLGTEFDELKLDRYTEFHLLSRELTESASDLGALDGELRGTIGYFDSYLNRLGRLSGDIQDRLLRLRMVPVATLSSRLHRTVRVTAEQRDKLVDLVIEGERVELDKTVLEEMADPLLHLLRNAVDHGIEPAALRRVLGKPERGEIRLRAFYEGNQVVIEVSDDGAGLHVEALRAAAVARGFVAEGDVDRLSQEELWSLAFLPGFSTANEVSEVSGRGVGLDVVKASAHRMKGSVSLSQRPGGGAKFTIRLPMTLAIARALLVEANGETLAIPLAAVTHILRVEREELENLGQDPVLRVDGRVYPVVRMGEALRLEQPADEHVRRVPVLLINVGDRQVALVADHLKEAREVVVKTLGSLVRHVHGVTGATLMGDGRVVLILNPAELVRRAPHPADATPLIRIPANLPGRALEVLIVDDSLSVRRVLTNLIRTAGWNPIVAKDGLDALEVMQHLPRTPDAILLDIEMPRMDGYELTATLRGQSSYRNVPIVMLTSRAGDKHRQKAFDVGATDYLVKPYQDETLLSVLRRLTREAANVSSAA